MRRKDSRLPGFLSRIVFSYARSARRSSLASKAAVLAVMPGVICAGAPHAAAIWRRPPLSAWSLAVSDRDMLTIKQKGGFTNLGGSAQVPLRTLSSADQDKIRNLLRTKGAFPAPTRSDSVFYDLTGEIDGETRTVHHVPEELVPAAVRSLVKPELPDR